MIKTLLVTGGAVGTGTVVAKGWKTPIVDSVVLPSHALTSDVAQEPVNTLVIPSSLEGGLVTTTSEFIPGGSGNEVTGGNTIYGCNNNVVFKGSDFTFTCPPPSIIDNSVIGPAPTTPLP